MNISICKLYDIFCRSFPPHYAQHGRSRHQTQTAAVTLPRYAAASASPPPMPPSYFLQSPPAPVRLSRRFA